MERQQNTCDLSSLAAAELSEELGKMVRALDGRQAGGHKQAVGVALALL